MFKQFTDGEIAIGFMFLASSILWGIMVAHCLFVFILSRLYYRTLAASPPISQQIGSAAFDYAKENPEVGVAALQYAKDNPELVKQSIQYAATTQQDGNRY